MQPIKAKNGPPFPLRLHVYDHPNQKLHFIRRKAGNKDWCKEQHRPQEFEKLNVQIPSFGQFTFRHRAPLLVQKDRVAKR
jgi:hypothetical protein